MRCTCVEAEYCLCRQCGKKGFMTKSEQNSALNNLNDSFGCDRTCFFDFTIKVFLFNENSYRLGVITLLNESSSLNLCQE